MVDKFAKMMTIILLITEAYYYNSWFNEHKKAIIKNSCVYTTKPAYVHNTHRHSNTYTLVYTIKHKVHTGYKIVHKHSSTWTYTQLSKVTGLWTECTIECLDHGLRQETSKRTQYTTVVDRG